MTDEITKEMQEAMKTPEVSDEDFKKAMLEIETMLDQPLDKPSPRFELQIEGEDSREIFMSAGLSRKLVSLIESEGGDTLQNNKMFLDADMQNQLCLEVLVDRNLHGEELYNSKMKAQALLDYKISTEEGDRLVTWIREHVLHFFMNSLKTLFKAGMDEKGAYQRLMLSLSGLGLLQQRNQ